MQIYVDINATCGGTGTKEYPFQRISEAAKTGFRRIIIPRDNMDAANDFEDDLEICAARNLREAAEWLVERAR